MLRDAWTEYELDRGRYLAAAMVYYAIVSLVPLLLLVLATLGLLLRFSELAGETRDRVLEAVETQFGAPVAEPIERLLAGLSHESVVATAIGLAGLLFAASVLFLHLRLAFRAIWRFEPPLAAASVGAMVRQTVIERVVAFGMVLGGGGLLLASLLVIGVTQQLNRWMGVILGGVSWLGQLGGWTLAASSAFLLATMTFAALLKVLPPASVRWRDIALASLLCAGSSVVASEVLALFGVLARESRSAYGLVGAFLAVILWMNTVAQVLFLGAEVCKVLTWRRKEIEAGSGSVAVIRPECPEVSDAVRVDSH